KMSDIWNRLKDHRKSQGAQRIEALFEADPSRASTFSTSAEGLVFDWSKTLIDARARDLLLELATPVPARREAMFSGERINETEDRAVLHTALRNLGGSVMVDGQDVMPEVRRTHERMRGFANAVRDGSFAGQGGRITDVINIGIGGSGLGTAMAVRDLAPWHDGPRVHFVSNVDGADIADTLKGLDPATTLVIVASKTFTTIETMTNARTALDWMSKSVAPPAAQFAALSSAVARTAEWGI